MIAADTSTWVAFLEGGGGEDAQLLDKATELKDVRLHDLRRTHATILISQNIDPRTVAGRLGHSGTGMLARHYAVNRGDIEAAQAFGER